MEAIDEKHYFSLMTFLFISGMCFAEQSKHIGCIYKFSGKIEFLKSGENIFKPITNAMPVHEGDKIKALKNSYADVILKDGTLIRVEENSEITLNTLKMQEQEKKFHN